MDENIVDPYGMTYDPNSGNIILGKSGPTTPLYVAEMNGISTDILQIHNLPSPYTGANNYFISDCKFVDTPSTNNVFVVTLGKTSDYTTYYLEFGNFPTDMTITKSLSLLDSWPSAIWASPKFTDVDPNNEWIVGIVGAWNGSGGYRDRIVRWDYTTGSQIGGDITSTPSPFTNGVKLHGWIDYDNTLIYLADDTTLRWYDYTSVTGLTGLSAIGSLVFSSGFGARGADYIPSLNNTIYLNNSNNMSQYFSITKTPSICDEDASSSSSSMSSSSMI
jgi:hypothetical protein